MTLWQGRILTTTAPASEATEPLDGTDSFLLELRYAEKLSTRIEDPNVERSDLLTLHDTLTASAPETC